MKKGTNRKMKSLLLWLLAFFSTISANADILLWTKAESPPKRLPQALKQAEKLVESEGMRHHYWDSATLTASGAWSLCLVTQACRTVNVIVPVKGDMTWHELDAIDPTRELPERSLLRRDLAEITRLTRQWAAGHLPGLTVTQDEKHPLIIAYHPRPFVIHPVLKDGSFAQGVLSASGPTRGGLFIRITDAGKTRPDCSPCETLFTPGPYWLSHHDTRYLTKAKSYIDVEWRVSFADEYSWAIAYTAPRAFPQTSQATGGNSGALPELVGAMDRILGPTNEWDPRKRPPISLMEALKIARAALGSTGDSSYCFDFRLWGDQRSDLRHGTWELYYMVNDGTKKYVTVTMEGEATVRDRQGEDHARFIDNDWGIEEGHIYSLEVAKERLKALCAGHNLHTPIEVTDTTIRVSYRTRKFEVYPWLEVAQQWDTRLIETTGPERDGFILTVQYADAPDQSGIPVPGGFGGCPTPAPYWQTTRRTLPTSKRDKLGTISLQVGPGLIRTIPEAEFFRTLVAPQQDAMN